MTALLMVAMLGAGIFLGALLRATFSCAAISRSQEQRHRADVMRDLRQLVTTRRTGPGGPGFLMISRARAPRGLR